MRKFLIITEHLKKVINKLKDNKNVIFDIDWQEIEQIIKRNLNYKLITIFILPPVKKFYIKD